MTNWIDTACTDTIQATNELLAAAQELAKALATDKIRGLDDYRLNAVGVDSSCVVPRK